MNLEQLTPLHGTFRSLISDSQGLENFQIVSGAFRQSYVLEVFRILILDSHSRFYVFILLLKIDN
jgi:hypothetical protein